MNDSPERPPLNDLALAERLRSADSDSLKRLLPHPTFSTRRERLTRIFQIGFNKCGTRSLYRFLQRSAIASAHFNRGLLALNIQTNMNEGNKPLAGPIDRYVAYTDIQRVAKEGIIEGVRFFRQFYEYYPLSYFILNTRDKDEWLQSRLRHGAGHYAARYARACGFSTIDEVVEYWSQDWDTHHQGVIDFFADKPGRLLVYDIKKGNPADMVAFLAPDFVTRVEDFRHEGDTAKIAAEAYEGNRPVIRRKRAERRAARAQGASPPSGDDPA